MDTCPDCGIALSVHHGRAQFDCDGATITHLRARLAEAERENEAWRALANWQHADQCVDWMGGQARAYLHGTIVARGPAVYVAAKLGLTKPKGAT